MPAVAVGAGWARVVASLDESCSGAAPPDVLLSFRAGDAHANPRPAAFPSVREFLAQEFMHALGVPASCSLMPLASRSEQALQEAANALQPSLRRQFIELAAVYERLNPRKLFPLGGVTQYSCSPCSDR